MAELSKERCVELLNAVIDHAGTARNTGETIHELLLIGFTADELINVFDFDEDDVRGVLVPDGFTFRDLYEALDAIDRQDIKRLTNASWEMALDERDRKVIKLYRKDRSEEEFVKVMEIYFNLDDTLEFKLFSMYTNQCSGPRRAVIDTMLSDRSWYDGLFITPCLDMQCASFLISLTEELKGRKKLTTS